MMGTTSRHNYFIRNMFGYFTKKTYPDFVGLLFRSEVKIKAFLFAFLSLFPYLCIKITQNTQPK